MSLELKLKTALVDYMDAINVYEDLVDQFGPSSTVTNYAFGSMQFAREDYLKLRRQFEEEKNTLQQYDEKLERYYRWRKEVGITCLLQKSEAIATIS